MQTIYHGNSKLSGVYKIYNRLNNKMYIGSCKEFKSRFNGHRNSLKKNKHANKHLQASYNKYGSDNFVFEVLEVVLGSKEERILKEQNYLNSYSSNWNLLYNIRKQATSADGKMFSKTPEETRKKMSASMKGKRLGEKRPEHSQLMSGSGNPMFGKSGNLAPGFGKKYNLGKRASEATRKKLSAIQKILKAKQHRLLSVKTNEEFTVTNLVQWCKDNKINQPDLVRTLNGKPKKHRKGSYRVLQVKGFKLLGPLN